MPSRTRPQGGPLFGPTQVQTNWWVFSSKSATPPTRSRTPTSPQLSQIQLDAALKEKRAATTIKRNLTTGDVDWALKNAG